MWWSWTDFDSLGYLFVLKIERGGHSLGLQLGEIQLNEPFLSNSLGRCHLTGNFAHAHLRFCAHWVGLQEEVVIRARKFYIIVHVHEGIRGPPVEVSLVLHINGAGAGADVC
jgi:hypothetical protein